MATTQTGSVNVHFFEDLPVFTHWFSDRVQYRGFVITGGHYQDTAGNEVLAYIVRYSNDELLRMCGLIPLMDTLVETKLLIDSRLAKLEDSDCFAPLLVPVYALENFCGTATWFDVKVFPSLEPSEERTLPQDKLQGSFVISNGSYYTLMRVRRETPYDDEYLYHTHSYLELMENPLPGILDRSRRLVTHPEGAMVLFHSSAEAIRFQEWLYMNGQ